MPWNGGKRESSGSRGARAESDEFSGTTAGKGACAYGPERRRSGHGYAALGSTTERRSAGGGGRVPRIAVQVANRIEEYVQRSRDDDDPHRTRICSGLVASPGNP